MHRNIDSTLDDESVDFDSALLHFEHHARLNCACRVDVDMALFPSPGAFRSTLLVENDNLEISKECLLVAEHVIDYHHVTEGFHYIENKFAYAAQVKQQLFSSKAKTSCARN